MGGAILNSRVKPGTNLQSRIREWAGFSKGFLWRDGDGRRSHQWGRFPGCRN